MKALGDFLQFPSPVQEASLLLRNRPPRADFESLARAGSKNCNWVRINRRTNSTHAAARQIIGVRRACD